MSGAAPYDHAGTMNRLGGDAGLYTDLVRFFVEDSRDLFGKVQTAAAAEDADGVQRASHALRGICANFGAEESINLCWTIERRAGVGDWREVRGAVSQLETAVKRLRTALEKSIA